jgi:hypothetical protein
MAAWAAPSEFLDTMTPFTRDFIPGFGMSTPLTNGAGLDIVRLAFGATAISAVKKDKDTTRKGGLNHG